MKIRIFNFTTLAKSNGSYDVVAQFFPTKRGGNRNRRERITPPWFSSISSLAIFVVRKRAWNERKDDTCSVIATWTLSSSSLPRLADAETLHGVHRLSIVAPFRAGAVSSGRNLPFENFGSADSAMKEEEEDRRRRQMLDRVNFVFFEDGVIKGTTLFSFFSREKEHVARRWTSGYHCFIVVASKRERIFL